MRKALSKLLQTCPLPLVQSSNKKKNLLRTKLPWKTAVRQHTGSLTLLSGDTAVRQLLASGTDAGTLCRLTSNNYVWRIRKAPPFFVGDVAHKGGHLCELLEK